MANKSVLNNGTDNKIDPARVKPRNDYVVLQLIDMGSSTGGVAIPEISFEGKQWFVVAIGPKVEDLKPGDEVEVMGKLGEDVARLPSRYPKGFFISKEANVLLKVEKE